jgi:hypothetical protein
VAGVRHGVRMTAGAYRRITRALPETSASGRDEQPLADRLA